MKLRQQQQNKKPAKALNALHQRWSAMAAREQNLVLAAATIVLLALIWWLALAPAIQTLRTAPARHAELDKQLRHMRSLQAEALELQKAPRAQGTDSARVLRDSVTQQLGTAAQVTIVGDRATVALKTASADRLGNWLSQVRASVRAVPLEAKLVNSSTTAAPKNAAATPTHWDGNVVLSLPAN